MLIGPIFLGSKGELREVYLLTRMAYVICPLDLILHPGFLVCQSVRVSIAFVVLFFVVGSACSQTAYLTKPLM